MASSSDGYHEPLELLSENSLNMHRAIVTAMEELEAIDWYQQRAEACTDDDLKKILLHNKEEEVEHAMMTLEWIRRQYPTFHEQAKTYLFTEGPITELEEEAMGKAEGEAEKGDTTNKDSVQSLGIGSLKGS